MDDVLAEALARLERLHGPDWAVFKGRSRAEAIYEQIRLIDRECLSPARREAAAPQRRAT